jgi:hypothetical protein
MPQLRQHDRPQRRLLQVPELRREPGVLLVERVVDIKRNETN